MIISNGTDSVDIPDSTEWIDEFEWQPVSMATTRTVNGGLIIERQALQSGRPITIESGQNVWINKTKLDALIQLSLDLTSQITLTLADGRVLNVVFDHSNDSAVKAQPVFRKNTGQHNSETIYNFSIKMLETE